MDYNIFLCYRGDSAQSCELGARIYQSMKKYSTFFAPECIKKGENFKTVIPEVMKNINIVILLLDKDFFKKNQDKDDIVDYEIRCALKNENILFLPITMGEFDFKNVDLDSLFSSDELERIKHINGIHYNGIYNFSIENDLLPYIDYLYDSGDFINTLSARNKNRYYDANGKNEVEFLKLQQDLVYDFDNDIYEKIFAGKSQLEVLDIGCNNATQTMRRFGCDERVSTIVGIDRDEQSITMAKSMYPNGIFEVIDVESANFKNGLTDLLNKYDLKKFDIINVSMLILHLEHPARFIQVIRHFLAKDGVLFIRDIDDGINFAYPDNDNIFARLVNICKYCDMLGFRHSGRQIFSYLKNADFRKVTIEKMGLNTSNMSYDEKEALFNVYFGYIPTALEKTLDRVFTLRAKHDYEWVTRILDDAYDQFMNRSFVFSLGYIIYTAMN